MFKKLDEHIVKILEAAIITIVTGFLAENYFGFLSKLINVLCSSVIVPFWLIVLCLILPLLLKLLWEYLVGTHFLIYKQDVFDSILWVWEYTKVGIRYDILKENLVPHCKECKRPLSEDDYEYYICMNNDCNNYNTHYTDKKKVNKDEVIKSIKYNIKKKYLKYPYSYRWLK